MYPTAATKPGEQLVRKCARLEPAPERRSGAGRTLYGRQRSKQLAARVREPEVRPEELVRRAEQHVHPRRGHVDRPVRGVVDGVDPGERSDLMREVGDAGGVDERPDSVRRPREGDDPRPLREQGGEVVEIQRRVVPDLREHHAHAEVALELEPGRDVAVVVEPRHDYLVAGGELPADRPRKGEVEGGHVRAEDDLLRSAAEEGAAEPRAWATISPLRRLVS